MNKMKIIILSAAFAFIFVLVGLVWVAMNYLEPKTTENLMKSVDRAGVTSEEAETIVRGLPEVKTYEAMLAESGKVATIEAEDNDTQWNVHVYEIVTQDGLSHSATFGWYQVDKRSGEVFSENSYDFLNDNSDSPTPKPFADVYAENENFKAIEYLSREGVLSGDENGNLYPEKIVSRAEWTQMLVKLVGADPDAEKYQNCYSDVSNESFAPAVCYAKDQGWISEAALPISIDKKLKLFATAYAQEPSSKRFSPQEPVKDEQAIGSLARAMSWDVSRLERAASEDSQNMAFARQAEIYKRKNTGETISRAQAAGIMFRSVATVSFGQEKYDPKNDAAVSKSPLNDLVDVRTVSDDEGFAKQKESYIRHYTSDFGKEKATELVNGSASESELRKNVRKYRFERMLESEKAAGKEARSFNAFRPIQSIFAGRGQSISIEDADIYKIDPVDQESKIKVTDPMFRPREDASISLFLDDKYRVISRSDLGSVKIAFMVNAEVSSFYGEGWTNDTRGVGFVTIDIVDFNTGVILAAGGSQRTVLTEGNLTNMYNTALQDMERRIGAEIKPPPRSRDESGYDPLAPDATDGTAEGSQTSSERSEISDLEKVNDDQAEDADTDGNADDNAKKCAELPIEEQDLGKNDPNSPCYDPEAAAAAAGGGTPSSTYPETDRPDVNWVLPR